MIPNAKNSTMEIYKWASNVLLLKWASNVLLLQWASNVLLLHIFFPTLSNL